MRPSVPVMVMSLLSISSIARSQARPTGLHSESPNARAAFGVEDTVPLVVQPAPVGQAPAPVAIDVEASGAVRTVEFHGVLGAVLETEIRVDAPGMVRPVGFRRSVRRPHRTHREGVASSCRVPCTMRLPPATYRVSARSMHGIGGRPWYLVVDRDMRVRVPDPVSLAVPLLATVGGGLVTFTGLIYSLVAGDLCLYCAPIDRSATIIGGLSVAAIGVAVLAGGLWALSRTRHSTNRIEVLGPAVAATSSSRR